MEGRGEGAHCNSQSAKIFLFQPQKAFPEAFFFLLRVIKSMVCNEICVNNSKR